MTIFGLCFDPAAKGAPFSHDPALVLLSIMVAAIASFCALEMAERQRGAQGRARQFWLLAGAIVLGGGIWSMHFISMIAVETPLDLGYDLGLTALSKVVAVAAVAAALKIIEDGPERRRLLAAGLVMGSGVVVMHYTGMAAWRVAGEVRYLPAPFGVSVMLALGAATAALWMATALQSPWRRGVGALIMAAAICGMHYTGMSSAQLIAGPAPIDLAPRVSEGALTVAVTVGTLAIVCMALVVAFIDRRLERRSMAEAERLRALNESLERRVVERTEALAALARQLDESRRRAESANAAKSDFLASMSHELRTPLNAVLGFSQLLLMPNAKEPLTDRQRRAVQQIERSGRLLLELIDEVLDLAKIEAGKISLSLEEVEVNLLVHEAVESFQAIALGAGVTIAADLPEDGFITCADRMRLRQILNNIIANAIKYNRRGGAVTVALSASGDRLEVAVSDTGLGIPAKQIQHLFEPFNRLGQEQSNIEGAGIGLAFAKRLVDLCGGEIDVRSEEGKGSVFTVRLPLVRLARGASLKVATAPHVEPTTPGAALMLYVEDNPSNVVLMRQIVREIEGLELHIATDAQAGLEAAARLHPNLILLDINLPQMDGFEVLRRLRADPATARTPVLALSANAMPREVARGEAAGFHRYLTKPIDIPTFLAALSEALDAADASPRKQAIA